MHVCGKLTQSQAMRHKSGYQGGQQGWLAQNIRGKEPGRLATLNFTNGDYMGASVITC